MERKMMMKFLKSNPRLKLAYAEIFLFLEDDYIYNAPAIIRHADKVGYFDGEADPELAKKRTRIAISQHLKRYIDHPPDGTASLFGCNRLPGHYGWRVKETVGIKRFRRPEKKGILPLLRAIRLFYQDRIKPEVIPLKKQQGRPMKYGDLLASLDEAEIYSAKFIVEMAAKSGRFETSENPIEAQERAFQAITRYFSRKFSRQPDGLAVTDNTFDPGWYGWRIKASLPGAEVAAERGIWREVMIQVLIYLLKKVSR